MCLIIDVFNQLQTRVSTIESQIADRRELFNDSLNIYNIRIEQFPDFILARMLRYPKQAYLKVPEEKTEDIFFITDAKEQVARRRIMKGLWQVWAWALLWVAMSLAMFHFQLPRTQHGYSLWSMQEIIQYAAPRDRLEAVLEFLERDAKRSHGQATPRFQFVGSIPYIGPFIGGINKNLRHAQRIEGSNFLWRQHLVNASEKDLRLLIRSADALSKTVRWWAVARLGETIAYPDRVVPVLINALEHDPDRNVKKAAASSLSHFKKEAFPAIPALVSAARSPQYKLRHQAIVTLTGLNNIPQGPAHDLFREMVENKQDWVRHAGVRGLRNMAHHTWQDADALLQRTADQDQYIRSLAIGALNAIAPDTPGFSQVVIDSLYDQEKVVRQSAVFALADVKSIPDEAAAPLGSMINDSSLSGRVLTLLTRMGERAAPAVPDLAKALGHKNGKVAYNAAFALSRICSAEVFAVNELLSALEHKDKFVRRYSAQALGKSGPAAVKAIPALIQLQQDPDPYVSRAARQAVTQLNRFP